MKRVVLVMSTALLCALASTVTAQKFALIDVEYILKNIPQYEMANEQLNQLSERWQAEVEKIQQESQTMYKNYQSELVFLSVEMRSKREEDILKKELEAQELKRKYFGAEGELFKRREQLIKPLQDEIYEACKAIAAEKGYDVIVDHASSIGIIIFASPKIDISNEVLLKMGYSK